MAARRHAAATHSWVLLEHHLHLLTEEFHSCQVDAVGPSSGEMEIAVFIEPTLVAGAEAVGFEYLAGRRPGSEIGVKRARAPDTDLPGVPGTGPRQRLAVLAAKPHLVAGLGSTQGLWLGACTHEVHHWQPHLDDTQGLDEGVPEARAKRLRDAGAQAFGRRHREPQRREPAFREVLGQEVVVKG